METSEKWITKCLLFRSQTKIVSYSYHHVIFLMFGRSDGFYCTLHVYFRLLDFAILLKAKHDELIHESITLYNHELILR